jgi:8-oxo-dGTP diphosphatase
MSDIQEHYKNRDPSKRICARAICIRGDEVLVIKRHKYGEDYMVLPGGGMDPGETDLQAAARELLEETSVTANPVKLLHTIPGIEGHSEQRIVLCDYVSGEPLLDPNSEEAQRTDNGQNTYNPTWVSLELAKQTLVPEQVRDVLLAL